MTLNRTAVASAALALALVACSSPKPGTPEFAQKKEEEQQKAVVKTVEQSLSVTPDWYKKNPGRPERAATPKRLKHPQTDKWP
jgi:hypothetical protein